MLSGLAQQQLTTGSLLLIQQPLLSNIQVKKRDLCKQDFFFKVSTSHCYAFTLSVTSRHLFIVGLNYENFDVFVDVRYSIKNIGLEFLWNKIRA